MNSYYKADLEHVRGTAVALVLATNRILAKVFWQHAFWGKERSRDSKGKRVEMSKMFKNQQKHQLCCLQTEHFFLYYSSTRAQWGKISFWVFFLSEPEGLNITAKAPKMKQNRHIQHLNTHTQPVPVCVQYINDIRPGKAFNFELLQLWGSAHDQLLISMTLKAQHTILPTPPSKILSTASLAVCRASEII